MAKKVLELFDSFELNFTKKNVKELKDSLEKGKALIVKVKATHGGYINGNRYYYTSDSMENATKTWIKPFNKPVLVHHTDDSDPIGRVIDAEYIPIKTNRKNKARGYILLTLRISNQDAIEKIIDGRYMTVSVGSKPENAICSICDRNIAVDGLCDHRRGSTYDDRLCYWSIDINKYTEVSFVNKPADEYQKGIEESELSDKNVEDDLNFDIEINKAECYLEDEEKINMKINSFDIDKVDGTWTEDDLKMVDWLMDQMENDETLEDAKLTTTARKKLSAGTFCGPNRSFPVNDCLHYRVALSYLNRYKGPGDKSRIKACIERRGKKLGCPSAVKKTKDNKEGIDVEDKLVKQFEDEINGLKEFKDKYKTVKSEYDVIVKDKETLVTEKQDLETQLSDKAKDIETLNEELIKFKGEKHQRLVDSLYELRVNLDKKDTKDLSDEEIKSYKENLSKRTDESLNDSISDLTIEVETKNDKPKEPSEKISKDSNDTQNESQTKIEDGNTKTEIEDLGDMLNKKE